MRFDRSVSGAAGGGAAPDRLRSSSLSRNWILRARELIERLEIVVGRDAGVGDEEHPVLHVIEGQHRVEQHEARQVGRGIGPRRPSSPSTGSNHAAAS